MVFIDHTGKLISDYAIEGEAKVSGVWVNKGQHYLLTKTKSKTLVETEVIDPTTAGVVHRFSYQSAAKVKLEEPEQWPLEVDGVYYYLETEGKKNALSAIGTTDWRKRASITLPKGKIFIRVLAQHRVLIAAQRGRKHHTQLLELDSGAVLYERKGGSRSGPPTLFAQHEADFFFLTQTRQILLGKKSNPYKDRISKLTAIRGGDGLVTFDQDIGYEASKGYADPLKKFGYLAARENEEGRPYKGDALLWRVSAEGAEQLYRTKRSCTPTLALVPQLYDAGLLFCQRRLIQFDGLDESSLRIQIQPDLIQYLPDGSGMFALERNTSRLQEIKLTPLGASPIRSTGRPGVKLAKNLGAAAMTVAVSAATSFAIVPIFSAAYSNGELAFSADSVKVYALNYGTRDVTIFDRHPLKRRGFIPVGAEPKSLEYNQDLNVIIAKTAKKLILIDTDSDLVKTEYAATNSAEFVRQGALAILADDNKIRIIDLATDAEVSQLDGLNGWTSILASPNVAAMDDTDSR